MKIRLLTDVIGAVVYGRGQIVDLSPKEAMRWIDSKQAEVYNEIEAAMVDYPENTTLAPEHTKKKRR